jgi:2-dehydropantoate 2-reductase
VLGWRLAQNPQVRVSVVCRSNYEAIQKNGISLKTAIWGAGHFRPARVCRNASELRHVPFDYVVCANKATGSSAHGSLASVIREKTVLVSAQNGVGVEEPLQRAFPGHTILSGIVYIACTQPTPGIFYQNTSINTRSLALGLFAKPACPDDHRARNSRLLDFASLESTFGISQDIVKEKWIKQLWNGAFNTMAAISGMNTHQLVSSPKHLELVAQVMRETYQVARASDVSLEDDIIERLLATTMSSAPVVPSMLQDAMAGKAMEIESLCGKSVSVSFL